MLAETLAHFPLLPGTKYNTYDSCSHAVLIRPTAEIIRCGHGGAPHGSDREEEEEAGEVFPVASSLVAGPLMMMWTHQRLVAWVVDYWEACWRPASSWAR